MSKLAYRRNVATIERLAKEILTQCGHYRRNEANGADDSSRVAFMDINAAALRKVTQQARRRWERERFA